MPTFGTPVQFSNASGTQTNPITTTGGGPSANGQLNIALGDCVKVVVRATTGSMATNAISDTLGNTYALKDSLGHGGGGQGIALYQCDSATFAGSSAITVTAAGAQLSSVWAVNVAGYTSTPLQATNGAEIAGGGTAGTDNYTASAVSVSTVKAIVFCFLHDVNAEGTANGPPVAGTGWTSLGATWQALGSGGNATALPIYKEIASSGSVSGVFSLTASNKSDFFWNETGAYTELVSNSATIAWTV